MIFSYFGILTSQFLDQYNQARKLREEDDTPSLLPCINMIRKAEERTGWMEEIIRRHGVIIIGECPSKFDYAVSHVSIPLGEDYIKFVPRFDGKEGTLIFSQPIVREWAEKGFLTNSYFDSSSHGGLFGDFEDGDGSYVSAELMKRINAERGRLPHTII